MKINILEDNLSEMAYTRGHAIELCSNLSNKFSEHFLKVMKSGIESPDFKHHCSEMQAWFNKVSSIRLKPDSKKITKTNIMDWFITDGRTPEDFIPEEYVDKYEDFCVGLLDGKTVEESFIDILK